MGRIRNLFTRKNPKVSASSLVETIVATVIIMIVFGIAMSSMLGVVKQTTENSTHKIDSKLQKLSYEYQNNVLKVPNTIEIPQWSIVIKEQQEGKLTFVVFRATHKKNKKTRTKKVIALKRINQ
jgi:Na+-translocating ferredoxin:NAD+ oxidoreductase RnfG subunit|tara:strand:+ start:3120 stop:3491 length:372 start_codon:yes stop_codon:yes gene_type:complete